MIYTFDTLRRQILRQLDEEDDTATSKTLASDYLNQAHQLWCSDPRMKSFLLLPEFEISVVTDKTLYGLPPMTDKLLYLRDPTSKRPLREIPSRSLIDQEHWPHPDHVDQDGYVLWGHWPVKRQPAAASVVTVVSDNSADTAQVLVKGLTSDGDLVADLLTLTGTTPVNGSVSFTQILAVTKEASASGNITVSDATGTLVQLQPLEFGRQYRVVELIKTPAEARTLKGRAFRKPIILINDYDVPDIPAPYSQGLVWEALLMFSGYNTDIGRTTQWERLRDEWKAAFDRHLWEGDTLGASGTYIHSGDPVWEW